MAHDDSSADPYADPLATAARQCWAGERAPDALRQQVAEQLARHRRNVAWWRRANGRAVAAAAAVVVGAFGLGLLHRSAGPTEAVPLPVAVEADLVSTHDRCSRAADHQHLPVARGNGYAIAASLRSQLARPVLVSRPTDDQWQFAGASVCAVGGVRAAHLVYRRPDGDTLSVFSLPRSSAPMAADGTEFQAQADGHPIAGFVRHRAVYCLVASGCADDVSLPRLADVCREMERHSVVADEPATRLPPGRELIH